MRESKNKKGEISASDLKKNIQGIFEILNVTPRPILQSHKFGWKWPVIIILEFSQPSSPIIFKSNFCISCMPTTFV